jgi:hypothetical protein
MALSSNVKVIVVNTCNQWNEYASFKFVGVFTGRTYLNRTLNKLLESDVIEWKNKDLNGTKVNGLKIDFLKRELGFVNLNIIFLNHEE